MGSAAVARLANPPVSDVEGLLLKKTSLAQVWKSPSRDLEEDVVVAITQGSLV